jgi:hypothetical protein
MDMRAASTRTKTNINKFVSTIKQNILTLKYFRIIE